MGERIEPDEHGRWTNPTGELVKLTASCAGQILTSFFVLQDAAASLVLPWLVDGDVEWSAEVVLPRHGPDVSPSARVHVSANVYGDAQVGDETMIAAFVEVTAGARIGARCKISSHSFVCAGVTIEDDVFVGHGVMFTNDREPRATNAAGRPAGPDDWTLVPTLVQRGASIGSGAVILPGLVVGAGAMVGAGAVVTRDVQAGSTVVGNPARVLEPKE